VTDQGSNFKNALSNNFLCFSYGMLFAVSKHTLPLPEFSKTFLPMKENDEHRWNNLNEIREIVSGIKNVFACFKRSSLSEKLD